MATEIERKFLVHATPELLGLLETAERKELLQGYLEPGPDTVIRVSMLMGIGRHGGSITVELAKDNGNTVEFGVHIPFQDAKEIRDLLCVDGVIVAEKHPTVRVRTTSRGTGVLTIKARGDGLSRPEYEYEIAQGIAQWIIRDFSKAYIDKTRYVFPAAGTDLHWELDVFTGSNTGLVVAEIEIPTADTKIPEPLWLAKDVTFQPEFTNVALSRKPFDQWPEEARAAIPDVSQLLALCNRG